MAYVESIILRIALQMITPGSAASQHASNALIAGAVQRTGRVPWRFPHPTFHSLAFDCCAVSSCLNFVPCPQTSVAPGPFIRLFWDPFITPIMNSYDCRFMMKLAVFSLMLRVARADRVCVTSDSGNIVCQNKLTTSTIVAIVAIIVLLLAFIGGVIAFLLYRRRQFAAAKAAVAANAYVIEASQMKGPAPFTTYSASYDPHSAPNGVAGLPMKPGSAKLTTPQTAPTNYGGVTYPFSGYSSPKGTPPKSQSAFSGTYTTMSGMGSGSKAAGMKALVDEVVQDCLGAGSRGITFCNLVLVMKGHSMGPSKRLFIHKDRRRR
ncbi:hypothetical protein B0H11DRAFT_949796 [Mycena galericulata]|nr:hypothetical protein B0H11DRAFT_949796 [Mycena galericulata]